MKQKSAHKLRQKSVVLLAAILFLMASAQIGGQAQPVSSRASIEKRVEDLLSKMTLEEKLAFIGGVNDFYIRALPRLGLPALRMSDGPMGVHDYGEATAYPAGIALAASWDTELAKRVGTAMGRDARARGVHFILGPGLNIYRAPLNGRNFEYFGEDPYLASRIAVGVIEGIQSQGVIATAKHFVANNMEYGRMDHSSDVDERTLREIYLPGFEASVKEAHVGALMDAYNQVNGTYMTENGFLNKQIARKEWGFDGIMMSDWGATHDGIAAANNGMDLEMPSGQFMNPRILQEAIQRGTVSVATIDDKVRRILRKAIEFGFYDREQTDRSIPLYDQKSREVALQEARAGMVLLKNENHLLPFDVHKVKSIAVLGPSAYPAVIGGGGSSLTKPFHSDSFLEGVSNYAGTNVQVLSVVDLPDIHEIVERTRFVATPGGEEGLRGEYFNNETLEGTPALVRTDRHVNFEWGEGSYADNGPVDHFSARWTGYFVPSSDDDYRFYVSSDDGARLYVDDVGVIDDWKHHGETLNTYAKHLQGGHAYKIRLEYFEGTGTATARLGVGTVSQPLSDAAKEITAKADAVVICAGFDANTEGEALDRTFQLPGGQDKYIEDVTAINKNVVVVLTAGGNVDMTGWIDKVRGVLHTWYPGQEGGTALAQILFGAYSPSGKLPASFERRWKDNPTFKSYYPQDGDKHVKYSEGMFVGYRHYDGDNVAKPLFPFGFGLSYTDFSYENLKVEAGEPGSTVLARVWFTIKNTGARDGAEVAQVYVGQSKPSVPRPVKELKGFVKVLLKPGESQRVSVNLDRRAFAFYDVNKHDWTVEPGEFIIYVGSSSAHIRMRNAFQLH